MNRKITSAKSNLFDQASKCMDKSTTSDYVLSATISIDPWKDNTFQRAIPARFLALMLRVFLSTARSSSKASSIRILMHDKVVYLSFLCRAQNPAHSAPVRAVYFVGKETVSSTVFMSDSACTRQIFLWGPLKIA